MTLTFSLILKFWRNAIGFAFANATDLARLLWLSVILLGFFSTLLSFSAQWSVAARVGGDNASFWPVSYYMGLLGAAFIGSMMSQAMLWMAVVRLRYGLPVSKGWMHFRFRWPETRFLVLIFFAILGVYLILNPAPLLQKSLLGLPFFEGRQTLAEQTTNGLLVFAVSVWLTGISLGSVIIAKERRFAIWRSLTLTFPHLWRLWVAWIIGYTGLIIFGAILLLLGEVIGLGASFIFLSSGILDVVEESKIYWAFYSIGATFNALIAAFFITCTVAFAAETYEHFTEAEGT